MVDGNHRLVPAMQVVEAQLIVRFALNVVHLNFAIESLDVEMDQPCFAFFLGFLLVYILVFLDGF